MNVLLLNNYFYLRGGSEKVLFEEMRILSEAEHRVAVFSRKDSKNKPSDYEDYFPPELNIDSTHFSFKSIRVVKELIYSKSARVGLRKVIKDFQPNIVHAHNIYGRLTASVLDELKSSEIPTVLTLHDLKLLCPSYLMLNRGKVCEKCKTGKFYNAVLTGCHKNSRIASAIYALETWINHFFKKYESINYFISPSRFLREKFIEYGWSPDRVVYIPNFIDSVQARSHSKVGKYLLYFGRLSREKGIKTLIKAMVSLKCKVGLTIAGDGPEQLALQNLARATYLPITFTGHLNGSRLREVINGARAVVIPSECYENAPLSLLESFALGKPIVGAKIGGISEMIEDGVDGYLFEPGSIDDLSDKLNLILGLEDNKIIAMGQAAKEKIKKQYNKNLHFKKLMQLYQTALSKSNGSFFDNKKLRNPM